MREWARGAIVRLKVNHSYFLGEFSAPGYQRAATNLELHSSVPYFDFCQRKRWIKGAFRLFFNLCLKYWQQNAILHHGTFMVREKQQLWSSDGTATTQQPLLDLTRADRWALHDTAKSHQANWDVTLAALWKDSSSSSPKNNQWNQVRTTFLLQKLTQTLLYLKAQLPSQTHPLRSTMTVQTIAKMYRKNMWYPKSMILIKSKVTVSLRWQTRCLVMCIVELRGDAQRTWSS